MPAQPKRRRKFAFGRLALYRRATHGTDEYLRGIVQEFVPGETSLSIPGIAGFALAYLRSLVRAMRSGPSWSHPEGKASLIPMSSRENRERTPRR
jgi:hypothetical protein